MKKSIFYTLLGVLFILLIILGIYTKWDIPVEELKKKYANKTSQFVQINGLDVHYRDEGEGKTIVLLHGTSSSLHTWEDWTTELKKKFRVVRMDLPAFGLTGPNQNHDYKISSYVSFLNQFLEKLQIDTCYLAGNSLGGHIAWEFALAYPHKVEKMILIDPSGYPSKRKAPWVFALAKTPILNKIVRYVTPQFFFRNNLKQVYADDSKVTPQLVERYYELNLREGNREAFIRRASTTPETNYRLLSKIQTPTLIQWGEADAWIPVGFADKFQKNLPNASKKVYKNVGHLPMEESPQESVQDAIQFFEKK